MSQSEEQGGAGRREVAYRVFAAEYDDADFSYSESDEERAPNYVVTPSGARVNRLFVVGVLTEVEQVNEDVLRARIVDPTGAFVAYAGQYQPDEMAFLDRAEPPTFVALTGKARTFQPEDSDTVYTSVRPESINEVDAETRDRWTVTTAERTLDRIQTMAGALSRSERGDDLGDALIASGVDEGLAAGTALALEHYGTTPTYLDALRETALDAARVVTGDLDEVERLTAAPDQQGTVTVADLDALEVSGTVDPAETTDSGADTPTTDETDATTTPDEGVQATEEPTTGDADAETTGVEPTEEPATEGAGVEAEAAAETALSSPDSEPAEPEPTDAEPTDAEPAESAADSSGDADDDIGDFEPSGADAAGTESTGEAGEEVGDFDPGEFELDEDEREEIEEEYGTDFSTGTEVDDPGQADIETPEPEPESGGESETAGDSGAVEAAEETEPAETANEAEPTEESGTEEPAGSGDATAETEDEAGEDADAAAATDEPAADVDLEDAVMDAMRDLDDGDGADRDALIERVADAAGADPEAVEAAVQDALMDGRCYEPDEATLKPI